MFFTNLFESNLVSKKLFQDIIYYTTTDSTNDDVWEEYQVREEYHSCDDQKLRHYDVITR